MDRLQDLPVSVIAGYLGSGKTTWINQRLQQSGGVRYGVLVNDFGELGIDQTLIAATEKNTIELTNGCVCCSIAHDVAEAVASLAERATRLDWILFEASGVADPERVFNQVENWPGFVLQEKITLIDAVRIRSLINDKFVGGHVRRQLFSDSQRVLTKLDQLPEQSVAGFLSWFEQQTGLCQNPTSDLDNDPANGTGMAHPEFYTASIEPTHLKDELELNNWLSTLPDAIVRVKGFVSLQGETWLVQKVGLNAEVKRYEADDVLSRLVLIGVAPIKAIGI